MMIKFEAGQDAMKSHRPGNVRDAMRAASVSVNENATPREVLATMDRAGVDELPIVTDRGEFRAMIERRVVERRIYDRGDEEAAAGTIAEEPVARTHPEEPIENAVYRMRAAEVPVLPVVSRNGRLEGVLVLDDVRHVPDLVEAVDASRREREEEAAADSRRVLTACALASAVLGVVLFALWVEGLTYGLPKWVTWVDALAAALAFIGAGAATSREMISVPIWAITGVGLIFAATIGFSLHESAWSTWVQLVIGIHFVGMAAVFGLALPRRHRVTRLAT